MTTESLPLLLKHLQRRSLLVGGALVGLVLIGGLLLGGTGLFAGFWQAYLVGFLFALGGSLGGLALLCIIHLAGGAWSHNVRRICEAAASTVWWIMPFFIPVLFNLKALYPWVHDSFVEGHHMVQGKVNHYLHAPFFITRYFIYFAIWAGFAWLFQQWSLAQDRTGSPVYRQRMRALAGPALLIYVLTMTGAAVDWVSSIEPLWFSSIYGVMFVIGHGITILAFSLTMVTWLSRYEPLKTSVTPDRLHSLGKLQFAFIVLWAYIEVSQFIIIWSGDLPEEVTWYMNRGYGPFQALTVAVVLLQFFIPFLGLLNRHAKRVPVVIQRVAMTLLVIRAVDLYWIVAPSIHEPLTEVYGEITAASHAPLFTWMDLAAPIGFAALWFGLFLRAYRKHPLLPLQDPMFSDQFDHERKAAA